MMIDKRIEFYEKENARLFRLIDSANPQNVNDLMIKTINEHEAVIRELKHIKKLNIPIVTKRTCVTCVFCQINRTSEFIYDRHKCTIVKQFVNITNATKHTCNEWTEMPF